MLQNLDNITACLPPWTLTVMIGGAAFNIRQPTAAEDDALVSKSASDRDILELCWQLFDEPRPLKSTLTRDTLAAMYIALVTFQHARYVLLMKAAGPVAASIDAQVALMHKKSAAAIAAADA